ncbi:NitT/TauT family transport system ATP-binding protein [Georgenia soli]|uniref:NitT/TauT family transport system ATP-binding protein n=1 Tax=Georgenia soli TaxID=638953 RepID=A0A2A9F290_9MICO|nr:ABC transporter ATP-binding protein [Georgenia soli]PFG45113.1 NitT/TauT family transport system ATP-binding protein [Georgenia soli]
MIAMTSTKASDIDMSIAPLNAVELDGVSVTFSTDRGEVNALAGITHNLTAGGFTSLIGPSGCGKSTLLRVVADLIAPTAGRATVLDDTPHNAREHRKIGFVFQDSTLLPWRTALQNVSLPLEVGPKNQVTPTRSPKELLELVGLGGRENAYPHELSGGMRQRVAIARALVTDPAILLMDEPFGALDEITRDRLNEELLRIWESTGTTVVFVTHSIAEAVFLSEEVVVLKAHPGRLHEVVDIDLGYPRGPHTRVEPNFSELCSQLRMLLESA